MFIARNHVQADVLGRGNNLSKDPGELDILCFLPVKLMDVYFFKFPSLMLIQISCDEKFICKVCGV